MLIDECALLYFFLLLVPVGVAGRYRRLSVAKWVAWVVVIWWALRVSAMVSLQRLLGFPLALQPEYLLLYARRAGWLGGIRMRWPNHFILCCSMCCRTDVAPTMPDDFISDHIPSGLVCRSSQASHLASDQLHFEGLC